MVRKIKFVLALTIFATLSLAFAEQARADSATIIGGSSLLSSSQGNQIATWLGQGNINLTNIFTKSFNDLKTVTNFHAAADGKGATISVLNVTFGNQSFLIGGYDPQSWDSKNNYHITLPDPERSAFLFNLTSNYRQDQKLSTDTFCTYCGTYQTQNNVGYGPTFGGGPDIFTYSSLEAGSAQTYSYGRNINFSNNILNIGSPTSTPFLINGLEVFTISPAQNTPVPEPATLVLLSTGLAGIGTAIRKRRNIYKSKE